MYCFVQSYKNAIEACERIEDIKKKYIYRDWYDERKVIHLNKKSY